MLAAIRFALSGMLAGVEIVPRLRRMTERRAVSIGPRRKIPWPARAPPGLAAASAFASCAFLLASAAVMLAATHAEAQKTTASITGRVTDGAGRALPGATVRLRSEAMPGDRSVATDGDGRFRFLLLPPGRYRAIVEIAGFQQREVEDIRLGIEQNATLDVMLQPTFTDEIIVSGGEPLVDVTSTATGTTFTSQLLQRVPVGRTIDPVLLLAGGAVDGGGERFGEVAGNPSVMGSSAAENRYVIDSLDVTDTGFGLFGTTVPVSFLAEVQVKTGGYEAEYGGALGGVVNAVTRSGGNELTGEVFGYSTDDSLTAAARQPEGRGYSVSRSEWDAGFALGGRILTDRLWYFLASDLARTDERISQQVRTLAGELVQNNAITRAHQQTSFIVKLTWQASDSTRVTGSVLGDPEVIDRHSSTLFFIDNLLVPESNPFYRARNRGGTNWRVSLDSMLDDDLVLEAMVGRHERKDSYLPILDAPSYQDHTSDGRWTGGIGQGVSFGGPRVSRSRDDRVRDQLRAAATWFVGDHQLKAGAQYFENTFDAASSAVGPSAARCVAVTRENPWFTGPGAYRLNSLTGDLEIVPPDCDSTGDGVVDGVQIPALPGNRWWLYDSAYFNSVFTNDSRGSSHEIALYLQDSWQVTGDVTINVGVRAESTEVRGDLSDRRPDTDLAFSFRDMISPRLGVVWDVAGRGRSRLYAHYGRFYESIPLDIAWRAFGNETFDFWFYTYPTSGGLPGAANAGELFYVLHCCDTRVDPNIEAQYLEEYVLGGEYALTHDVAVGIRGTYRTVGRAVEDLSVDGGNTYFITNPGGCWTSNPVTGASLEQEVCFPRPSRYYRAVELSVDKNFSNEWQGRLSVVWSRLEGNYEGLFSRSNGQLDPHLTTSFDLPSLLIGARGLLPNDREWQIKAYGSYQFNFDLVIGGAFQYLTGTPVNKLGAHSVYLLDQRFVVRRGSAGRTPDHLRLDVHLAYPIWVDGGTRLELIADVFNLTDEQRAYQVDQRWTTLKEDEVEGLTPDEQRTNDRWGRALWYWPPRSIRLGARLSF